MGGGSHILEGEGGRGRRGRWEEEGGGDGDGSGGNPALLELWSASGISKAQPIPWSRKASLFKLLSGSAPLLLSRSAVQGHPAPQFQEKPSSRGAQHPSSLLLPVEAGARRSAVLSARLAGEAGPGGPRGGTPGGSC